MSKRKSKSEGFGLLSWLKKSKTEASEGDHNSKTITSSNTGLMENAHCVIVTESAVTSSSSSNIAIKSFSNIIAVSSALIYGSESSSTLTSSSSVISSDSDIHKGGNINVINYDTKNDDTILVCAHDATVPVRPVGPAPLTSNSVAVSHVSAISDSADDNTAAIKSSSATAQPNSKQGNVDCFYRGMKLNLSELCKLNSSLKQYVLNTGNRSYRYVKCELCEKYEHVARKHSKNGTCPLASGIRADERKRIEMVIDHLFSQCHSAVTEHQRLEKLYDMQSEKHPWISILKNQRAGVVDHLIRLCIDVYNDSLYETLAAHNWPARSLAQLHAATVSRDMDAPFVSYNPPGSDLHYRDPSVYREMLEVIGNLQKQTLNEELKSSIAFAIQLDGSADRRMVDNKFTSVRFVKGPPTYELCTGFLTVSQPQKGGAEGLLEAALDALTGSDTSKLIGITTDGESANTGKDKGLWKLLSQALNKNLLTVWCIAHRSDLAMESIIVTVPELKIWKSNLKSVSTYYRTSSKRTKNLSVLLPNCKRFPAHFDVRFVEHLCNLIESVLFNLPGCRSHWTELVKNGERSEKPEAKGFLNIWENNSVQHSLVDYCHGRYLQHLSATPETVATQ